MNKAAAETLAQRIANDDSEAVVVFYNRGDSVRHYDVCRAIDVPWFVGPSCAITSRHTPSQEPAK